MSPGTIVKKDVIYEDAEFPNAVALVKWVNAQVARHQDSWQLYGLDTAMSTNDQIWCGLTFHPKTS